MRDLPDPLHWKGVICKCEELTKRVVCAGPLTLLIVGGEEESVVRSREVNIVINFRETRHWRKEKWETSSCNRRWSCIDRSHQSAHLVVGHRAWESSQRWLLEVVSGYWVLQKKWTSSSSRSSCQEVESMAMCLTFTPAESYDKRFFFWSVARTVNLEPVNLI